MSYRRLGFALRRRTELRLNGWHVLAGAVAFTLAVVWTAHYLVDILCEALGC